MARIAVVDDEPGIVWALEQFLSGRGHEVVRAATAEEALRSFEGRAPDVAIIDIRLPGLDGLSAAEQVRERFPATKVVILTAHGTMEHAARAMRLGAAEYLNKPVDLAEVGRVIDRALGGGGVAVPAALSDFGIVGRTPAILELFKQAATVAASDACVLLEGESGTGKELFARAIHHYSRRSSGPFEPINCAAMVETLLESELYGHERGAFTGAIARKPGKFEVAGGGTVFLDEIGDLSPGGQAKLLRFLDEKVFERVGGTERVQADVRIIAATNQDLEALTAQERFRRDLYFRLNVVTLKLPPLRERMDDLPLLVAHFAALAKTRGVGDAAMKLLRAYSWPGNVRELRHAIERGAVLSRGGTIGPEHLPESVRSPHAAPAVTLEQRVAALAREFAPADKRFDRWTALFEKAMIEAALASTGGNLVQAAKQLGISRVTLRAKMKSYGIK